MTRKRLILATALVALVVLSAGCIGLFGDDTTDETPIDDSTDANGAGTPADDGTSGGDGVSDGDDTGPADDDATPTPSGGDAVDGDILFDEHSDALRAADGFAAEKRVDLTREGEYIGAEERSIVYNLNDDYGADVRTFSTADSSIVIERYMTEETTWWKEDDDQPLMYDDREITPGRYIGPVFAVEFSDFHPDGAGIEFEATAETTYNGEDVTQYEATGYAEGADEVEALLFVNDDGVIVYIEMDVTEGDNEWEVEMEITDIGDVTIETPEWVPEDDE